MSEILDIDQTIAVFEENIEFIKSDTGYAIHLVEKFKTPLNRIPALVINLAYKNQELFNYVSDLLDVYTSLDNLLPTSDIIVYIQTLDIWVVSKNPNIIHTIITKSELEMYEIIMDYSKVILVCEKNQKTLEMIWKKIQECLGVIPRIDKANLCGPNESRIIINNSSGKTSTEILNIIKNNISMIDSNKANSIRLEPFEIDGRNSYHKIKINIMKNGKCMDLDQFREYMGIVIPQINNSNVTINFTQNIGTQNVQKYDSEIIKNWIHDNPPYRLSKEEYYKLFKAKCIPKQNISKNEFSSLMMSIGYSTHSSARPRTWIFTN